MDVTRRTWIAPIAAALIVVASVAVIFGIPVVNQLARTAGNVVKTGEVMSVRIFVTTYGGRSPLAVVALAAWQAMLVILPHESVIRAASGLFGPGIGALASWAGLVLGSTVLFALAKALIGDPLSRWRERRFGPAQDATGVGRLVLLGIRAVPFVPQDMVSLACGFTRMRWRDYILVTALGWLPTVAFYSAFPRDVPDVAAAAFTIGTSVLGVGLLAVLGWLHRREIPWGEISASRRKQLVNGAILVVAGTAAYLLVPGVKTWVDTGIDVLARGDVGFVRDYLRGFGVWAPVISALLMVLQSIAAPLPAFVITFANGLLFGWAWGALLSWSSAMAGAALCFYLARALGRPAVEKLVGGSSALEVSDLFFERYGDRAVVIARLLPFVSFDIISYGTGLTSMGFWRFFIATGIGQLPATLVYSYLGQNLTGSVRVLFFIFIFTAVVFVIGATMRPVFMKRLRERAAIEEKEHLEASA